MATQLLAAGSTAATSATQTIGDSERHVILLVSTAVDPFAIIEIEADTGTFVRHLTLSDMTEDTRTAELFGPLTYRIRRLTGHGSCSVWNDQ